MVTDMVGKQQQRQGVNPVPAIRKYERYLKSYTYQFGQSHEQAFRYR